MIIPFEGTSGAAAPAASHRKVEKESSYASSLSSKGIIKQSEGISIPAVNRETKDDVSEKSRNVCHVF